MKHIILSIKKNMFVRRYLIKLINAEVLREMQKIMRSMRSIHVNRVHVQSKVHVQYMSILRHV